MTVERHECSELAAARAQSSDLGGFTSSIEGPFLDEKGRVLLGIEEYAIVIFYCPFCGKRLSYCNSPCKEDDEIQCHKLPGHEPPHAGNGIGIRREW